MSPSTLHPTVGVLALQGDFSKHIEMLKSLNVNAIEVRKPSDLALCNGLIIPGGESTTMLRHLNQNDFFEKLKDFSKEHPLFGTCAGLILMSEKVIGHQMDTLGLLEIQVERNAFGRQAESFQVTLELHLEKGKSKPIEAIFIRAPRIKNISSNVKILANYNEEPVLVKQGIHLGAAFHPELTTGTFVHQYFIEMIQKNIKIHGN